MILFLTDFTSKSRHCAIVLI